jgi:aspartokinase
MLDEADLIDDLLEAVVEQRESVKDGDHFVMQNLMKRVQEVAFRVQAQENKRAGITESLSKELGCEPNVSALSRAVPEEERALFIGAGERLGHSVFALKSEIAILSGIIEHNERFSAMLLSEWRRMNADFTHTGGFDFKG